MEFRKENILKILIGLGCLAIVTSAYVRWGQPYVSELSARHLDSQRVKNLESLDYYLNGSAPIGKNNTIYISLPSTQESCSDLTLPSLPDGWSYHCVSAGNLTKTDGTGWLPFKFDKALSTLPVDPVNNADTLEYYSFVVSNNYTRTYVRTPEDTWRAVDRFNTATYSLTASIETHKYIESKAQADNGTDPFRYEVSSDPKIWAAAQGVIGYWSMDEYVDSQTGDLSQSFGNLYISNKLQITKNDCLRSGCIRLFDLNQAINLTAETSKIINPKKGLTVTIWVKLEKNDPDHEAYDLITLRPFTLYAYVTSPTLNVLSGVYQNENWILANNQNSTKFGEWHQVGFTFGYIEQINAIGIANIVDGKIYEPKKIETRDLIELQNLTINKRGLYKGLIDNLKIYSRSTSEKELLKSYTSDLSTR